MELAMDWILRAAAKNVNLALMWFSAEEGRFEDAMTHQLMYLVNSEELTQSYLSAKEEDSKVHRDLLDIAWYGKAQRQEW